MNEQNNNNITLMTDIDPSLYTNLKPKQQAFIHCIAESIGSMTTTEFSRKDLKDIANDHGIAWAPELAAYRNSLRSAPKDVVAECCEDVVGDAVEVPQVKTA